MAKYVNAAQKTKTLLRETFWQLYQEKAIEKITVREIIAEAHLNRSTFYEYYSDIYAVLNEIEEELFNELFENGSQLLSDYQSSLDELLYDIAQKYRKHQKYLKVLLGRHGDPLFVDKLKERMKLLLRPFIVSSDMPISQNPDYFLEYVTNGLIGILMYWQQKDRKRPIEDLLKICKEIVLPEQFLIPQEA
ncbi:MAG: TetR/AcrR family transcriptional regulator C-terminal domain-containing protein [Eubacteriales bacterium]|nr:TetR/AcrR family transcriptional regulator C-terminal domain-containing protein [Eubacteriales bacterium]